MNEKEFLERVSVELKILKNSHYTIRNYTSLIKSFFNFIKKEPDTIEETDIKKYIAEKLSDKSSSLIIISKPALSLPQFPQDKMVGHQF